MIHLTIKFSDLQDQFMVPTSSGDTVKQLKQNLTSCEGYTYPDWEFIDFTYQGNLLGDELRVLGIGVQDGDTIDAEVSLRWKALNNLKKNNIPATLDAFEEAIESGNPTHLSDFVNSEVDKGSVMTLVLAASKPEIFKLLLETGKYCINGITEDDIPLIHAVCREPRTLKILVDAGADTSTAVSDGFTLLMSYIESDSEDIDVCKYILNTTVKSEDRVTYINTKSINEKTAMSLAIANGCLPIMNFLREEKGVFDEKCLEVACESTSDNNYEILQHVLASCSFAEDCKEAGETALMRLCTNKSASSLSMIHYHIAMKLGISLSKDPAILDNLSVPDGQLPSEVIFNSALKELSSPSTKTDVVSDYVRNKLHTNELLLNEVQRRGTIGSTVLNCACFNESIHGVEIVKLILSISRKEVPLVNDNGVGPLWMASLNTPNGAAILKLLIEAARKEGFDIAKLLSDRDSSNVTPLGNAVQDACLRRSEVLLEAGANPHEIVGENVSILELAFFCCVLNFIKRLVDDFGCKIRKEDFPFIRAVDNDQHGVLDYVIQLASAANMNLSDLANQETKDGRTPLIATLEHSDGLAADTLVRFGAKPTTKYIKLLKEGLAEDSINPLYHPSIRNLAFVYPELKIPTP
eukprot:TRINITY_DN683_c0_g1_i12.p1 TRINITY_DN683_c0_g1~~TRINITY_DN683_c0_g1_i12.p1  ORF type:complete len:637 (+),score=115.02 TRINITY_DN683_c0_g1_i12:616-2526(+)